MINVTLRKDEQYMGKFCIVCDIYQYVYGRTYDEAYEEWLNSVVSRVKESSLRNYKAKFQKHILLVCREIPVLITAQGVVISSMSSFFPEFCYPLF